MRELTNREIAQLQNIAFEYGQLEEVGGVITLTGDLELIPNLHPTPEKGYRSIIQDLSKVMLFFHTHPPTGCECLSPEDYEQSLKIGKPSIVIHAGKLTFDGFCPYGEGKFSNLPLSPTAGQYDPGKRLSKQRTSSVDKQYDPDLQSYQCIGELFPLKEEVFSKSDSSSNLESLENYGISAYEKYFTEALHKRRRVR